MISLGSPLRAAAKSANMAAGSAQGYSQKGMWRDSQLSSSLALRRRNNNSLRRQSNSTKRSFAQEGCTAHEAKPLQCKVAMGCKPYGEDLMLWFMLSHIINTNDPESIRQYAQYLKSGGKAIPGGQLDELITDKEQLKNMLNYRALK
jgi:hypothetical protein